MEKDAHSIQVCVSFFIYKKVVKILLYCIDVTIESKYNEEELNDNGYHYHLKNQKVVKNHANKKIYETSPCKCAPYDRTCRL